LLIPSFFYPVKEALFACPFSLLPHDKALFAETIAPIINELNLLHPFREGNGRGIRYFPSLTLLIIYPSILLIVLSSVNSFIG